VPPQTIDEVLAELDQIIHWARDARSRLGFFAALYRNVTIKVKEGIGTGFFEDGVRMEKFDVMFANRYLAALRAFAPGKTPASAGWSPFKQPINGRPSSCSNF
jgi:hypothetical protein